MAKDDGKLWERPWSTQELIDSADKWTLACDVALLNTLKKFADDIVTKSTEINNRLNNLSLKLDETSLQLNLSHNQFQSLKNSQFIESRVYEEDEALPPKKEPSKENPNENDEQQKVNSMKQAVSLGLQVIDNYFDKVEVTVSDTEEEESDFLSYVLRPKDLYINRSLPYVIGTEDWYKKWHVGLEESSSDSEVEKVTDKYSDSDADSELPIPDRSQLKGASDTSSELDFSNKTNTSKPVVNSTLGDSTTDILGSSDSDQSSLPVQTPISNQNFAEQLAEKLGNVINNKSDIIEPEVNTRPIQKVTETDRFPGIFFNEPPPLDDEDILPTSAKKGLFSGGDSLFDNEDDDKLLYTQKKEDTSKSYEKAKPNTDLFDEDDTKDGVFTNATLKGKSISQKETSTILQARSKGLFDDESSDEDLFKPVKTTFNKRPSYLQPFKKPMLPLFDDEPPSLDTDKETKPQVAAQKKKPVGGVSLLGDVDIFANQKISSILRNRPPSSSDSSETESEAKLNKSDNQIEQEIDIKIESERPVLPPKGKLKVLEDDVSSKQSYENKPKVESVIPKLFDSAVAMKDEEQTQKPKKISLFDDMDDLFTDDLFTGITNKKFTSSLFDDDLKDDLFGARSKVPKIGVKTNLFDSTADIQDFSTETKTVTKNISSNETQTTKQKEPIDSVKDENAEDTLQDNAKSESLLEKSFSLPDNKDSVNVYKSEEIIDTKTKREVTKTENISPKKDEPTSLVQKNDIFSNSSKRLIEKAEPKFSLFDDEPPDDVDDLFSKITKPKPKLDPSEATTLREDKESKSDKSNTGDSNIRDLSKSEDKESSTNLRETSSKLDESKPSRPTHINLFDPTPPPDDDEWDTKSDENDPFSDNYDSNQRSNLFDDPVSSLMYNSSGIGHENTRLETDASSFYPYASSSRRLSTDIYNDQQSVDSFFVTKNTTEPPNLQIIQEDTKTNELPNATNQTTSDLEITPSGISKDLYSPSTSNVQKTAGDLLDNKSKSSDVPSDVNVNNKNETIQDSLDNDDKINRNDIISEVGSSSTKPETKSKIAHITDLLRNDNDEQIVKEKTTGSPGKLKHNLNINVNALIPGFAPPKRKDLPKSQSFESPGVDELDFMSLPGSKSNLNEQNQPSEVKKPGLERSSSFDNPTNIKVLHSMTKDRVRIPVKRKPSTRRGRQELKKRASVADEDFLQDDRDNQSSDNKSSIFSDDNVKKEVPDILGSRKMDTETREKSTETTKTIRSLDDTSSFGVTGLFEENRTKIETPRDNSSITNQDKSLFIEKSESVRKNISKNTISEAKIIKTKEKITSLFDEDEAEDLFSNRSKKTDPLFDVDDSNENSYGISLLGASEPVEITHKQTENINKNASEQITNKQNETLTNKSVKRKDEKIVKKKGDIFDDSDDDDIFKKLPSKALVTKKQKSLFNDDSDDDDIFGASNRQTKSTEKTSEKKVEKRTSIKPPNIKKLENTETDEDPLFALLNK